MARLGRGRPNRPVVVTGHPLGNAAQPTPQPHVVTTSRRGFGRIVFTRNPQSPPPSAAATRPLVHTTSTRRSGTANVLRGRPGLFPTTPRPIVVTRSASRRGVVRLLKAGGSLAALPSGLPGVVTPTGRWAQVAPTQKQATVNPTEQQGTA